MEINQQKLDEFQARMSNWVASQGLLFQLTHGGGVRGAQSSIWIWIVRMAARVFGLVAIAVAIFWIYLVRRVDSTNFKDTLNVKVADALGADEATIGGLDRTRGHLEISKMDLTGGEESFFDRAELRGFRARMGLLDGVFGTWDGETVTIAELNLSVRAGAEDEEQGHKLFQPLFRQSDHFRFSRIDLEKATISWGYSPVTKGRIENARIRGTRTPGGWSLRVEGGEFSQNWLRKLQIVKMEIDLRDDGVEIREAKFRRGNGEVNLKATLEGPVTNPKLKGAGTLRGVPIDKYLDQEVREFVGGRLSGDFILGGTPYGATGITMTANIVLGADDEIVFLGDKINLLNAVSVVDRHRSYKKIRFQNGRFKLETGGKVAAFSKIWLHSKDLMRLEGEFVARRPTTKEVDEAYNYENKIGDSPEPEPEPEEAARVEPLNFDLGEALKEARDDLKDEIRFDEDFQFRDLGREGELIEKKRLKEIPILKGYLFFGLHAKAFERAGELSERYPVDEATGLRKVKVDLKGSLDEAGLSLAQEIMKRADN